MSESSAISAGLKPARPLWLTLPGVAFQLFGTFCLPFIVGATAGAVFEVSEVVETLPAMMAFTIVFMVPIGLAQLLGLVLKSRREVVFHWGRGTLSIRRLVDIVHDHLRVITPRGWSFLLGGCAFVGFSLAFKWASLGMTAVLGLFLFYGVVGWTVFLSTFLVQSFEKGIGRARSGIERSMHPAVCLTGADTEEVFLLRRVPVPWGYVLLIEDSLPDGLGSESRYQVGGGARVGEVERRGRIRKTPRGIHRLGPARLWYQDLLGLTRISIASMATADLKVLPRIRRIRVLEPPRSSRSTPDSRTRPHRFPTEDYFRFREYVPGDDSRRIHWKLSMKTGALQVRLPETREITRNDVILVVDSFVPKRTTTDAILGADHLLDRVIDAALGLTRTLVDRGERVQWVTSALSPDFKQRTIERMTARTGQSARWQDLASRVAWQSDHDLEQLLKQIDDVGEVVVLTARFTKAPEFHIEGLKTTWVFMDPVTALPKEDPHWLATVFQRPGTPLLAFFTRPHPTGSDDNGLITRFRSAWRIRRQWAARRRLRTLAIHRVGRTQSEVASRGHSVYRMEFTPSHVTLRGISGPGGLG